MDPREIPINADVEPDCDGDGFGDETQDSDLSSCPAAPDTTPPTASITAGPSDKVKTKKMRAKATFEFTGTDARAIASFQCSLDGAGFAPCTSPYTVKIKKGTHSFQVRAFDQAGNVSQPATDDWKVKRKKGKR